jgi:hypothetical protein
MSYVNENPEISWEIKTATFRLLAQSSSNCITAYPIVCTYTYYITQIILQVWQPIWYYVSTEGRPKFIGLSILQYKVSLNVLKLFKQDFHLNGIQKFSFKIMEYTLFLYLTNLLVLFWEIQIEFCLL